MRYFVNCGLRLIGLCLIGKCQRLIVCGCVSDVPIILCIRRIVLRFLLCIKPFQTSFICFNLQIGFYYFFHENIVVYVTEARSLSATYDLHTSNLFTGKRGIVTLDTILGTLDRTYGLFWKRGKN